MKKIIFCLTFLLSSCAMLETSISDFRAFSNRGFNNAGVDMVKPGNSKEEVITKLGIPSKEYSKLGYDYMSYRNGIITLRNNIVIKTDESPFAKEIKLSVDSQVRKNFSIINKKIFITSANNKNDDGSIAFDNVRVQVQATLKEKGVTFVDSYKDADAILLVNLGVSDPQINTKRDIVPIFSYDSGSSSTSKVTNGYGSTIGTINTTTPGKGLQVVGSQEVVTQVISYAKYLVFSLVVNDNKLKQGVQACRVDSISIDSNSDLRLYTPSLLLTAIDYLCIDTQLSKSITYQPDDIKMNVALFGIVD